MIHTKMNRNNNISPLPWYQSINEQDWRKSYAYGDVYPLYTLANTLLPFQIVRPTRANGISFVRVYRKDGTLVSTITSRMIEAGLQVKRFQSLGYDVIIFGGALPVMDNQFDGQYYAVMSDGVQTWYSEVWTVVQDMTPYLRVEWYDLEDMAFDGGRICYEDVAYKNVLYFAAEVGKPEYTFEEEGENRDGFFFPEKQISEKTYKCTVLAPEYLCDVMRFIRMADYVTITDKYGRVYPCDTFLITPKWETQGNLASVEIEFQTDTVAKKIGRAVVMSGADFNNDYNNDFLIEETASE